MTEIQKISQLTPRELVELRVTLESMSNNEYQCHKCLNQFRGMKDETALVDANLARKACASPAAGFVHRLSDISGTISFKQCPGNYVSPAVLGLLTAFDAYERGIPPFPGGYFDQPTRVIEAFEYINAWRQDRGRKAEGRAMKAMQNKKGGLIG